MQPQFGYAFSALDDGLRQNARNFLSAHKTIFLTDIFVYPEERGNVLYNK
jgi:hypothetical protein